MKNLIYTLTFILAFASVQASELSNILDELKDLVTLSDRVRALEEKPDMPSGLMEGIEARINALENTPKSKDESAKFTFVLMDDDGDDFADDEWEEIITKGQAIQAEYWQKKEAFWGDRLSSPSGEGWLGSSTMPVIRILCVEPEYFFHNTIRLPGRFQIICATRWGSMLRFFGDGDRVLIDDIAYGVATMAPVGLYVEPTTTVQTSAGTMISRPFEQGLENMILVAHNGCLPVYLAQDQDRFWMRACKVLQHQGRLSDYIQIGIKHGPPLKARDYPFPSIQSTEGNVYLADPVFDELQLEGPHSHKSPQAAIFISGNNMRFSNLNLYGWKMGVYAHGGQGRYLTMTMHHGETADGRQFAPKDQMLPFIFCTRPGANPDMVPDHVAGFKGWVLPKRSPAPKTAGWHTKGELLF